MTALEIVNCSNQTQEWDVCKKIVGLIDKYYEQLPTDFVYELSREFTKLTN